MTSQPESEILRVARQFREALARHDAAALKRLTTAYLNMYARLRDKIDLLVLEMEADYPTAGQLVRMGRYNALMTQIEEELTGYQVILRNEIDTVSREAIGFAGRDFARMLRVMGSEYGVGIRFNRLPSETIKTLLGFLSEGSPLYERIGQLAGANAEIVAQKIVEGVGLGYNPRKIAGMIRDSLGGGLTDALRMTRTVQLWSYREASRANYLANSDVVEGWIWYADLAGDPCMACIAEHGSIHGLDESLNDHHNGHCAPLPYVSGLPNPVEQTGEDWFSTLDEAKQRELMGEGRYDAWKGGAFEFNKLIGRHDDAVYGPMRVETPLWELLGAEPPERIK